MDSGFHMQKSRAAKSPPKVRRRSAVQLDLPVILDSPLMKAVHSDRYLLEYPFFDLSKTAKRKRLAFFDGPVTIEVKAIEGQGVATIFDRDMIMYAASLMVQKIEAGENPGREFVFSGRDFCLVSGRDTGGDSYDLLSKTVERLKGTVIKTNIETGGRGVDGYFSWLDGGSGIAYDIDQVTRKKRLSYIRVVLCEWLYRAILRDRSILAVHEDYFTLKPIGRRLYDLAKVHCGDHQEWRTTLGQLHKLVGSDMDVRNFKVEIGKQAGEVPDYRFEITDEFDGETRGRGRRQSARLIVVVRPKGSADDAIGPPPVLVDLIDLMNEEVPT